MDSSEDLINQEIWTDSIEIQREICRSTNTGSGSSLAGAQQAMPKVCDQSLFSADNPLPWVPDVVGAHFSTESRGVLVVGSSYNGFLEGYSRREVTLSTGVYAKARDQIDPAAGIRSFLANFGKLVVDRDRSYYQPILHDLLKGAGLIRENLCLTDLCKASFAERGPGPDDGNRADKGSDWIIQAYWQQWVRYIVGPNNCDSDPPLPYRWIWRRMVQCGSIVALGTIAEYGILEIFNRMAASPRVQSWKETGILPDHPSLHPGSPWAYGYACSRRRLNHWGDNEDWWLLVDGKTGRRWHLLPVLHSAAAIHRGFDCRYARTAERLRNMLNKRT